MAVEKPDPLFHAIDDGRAGRICEIDRGYAMGEARRLEADLPESAGIFELPD